MNKQYYNLGLSYCTTDIIGRLYDAAKWCYENKYKPKQVNISEKTFKEFFWHPQLVGRLSIDKYFPPCIEILGFIFQVDLNLPEQSEYNVPLLSGYVTIQDALVFNFDKE